MSRVLLTGVTGFIGAQLAHLLLDQGHDVTSIIRPGSNRWRIVDVETHLTVIEADLGDSTHLVDRVRRVRPDLCIHLAWQGWSGDAADNLGSLVHSLDLLSTMATVGCQRFVAAGTCFEYELSRTPLCESSTPLRPSDLYGVCKKSLYEVAQSFSALTGMSVATPRLFYSYGPYQDRRRLVPSIAISLLEGRTARVTPRPLVRDYLHVEDVASAIWTIAASGVTGAVNVGSGEPVAIGTIARFIGDYLGRPELIDLSESADRRAEPMQILSDTTRLRREFDWSPRYDLERGLAQTLDWWRSSARGTLGA